MNDSVSKKPSAARRAVNKVKSAPQKIVEHALNTAINAVEKAANTDVKRSAKRAAKTAKKLEKVQKLARAAKSQVKRATTMSSSLKKMEEGKKGSKSKQIKGVIKEKIKDIITPQKEVSFYYDRRQLVVLLALYGMIAVFVYLISDNLVRVDLYDNWMLFGFLCATQILILLALVITLFVTIVPFRLAYVNKEGIKIDHNQTLLWDDVEVAEEKYTSYISRRPFIAMHLKEGRLKNYRLTFMQKLCQDNIFTPFSIPMYAMRPEDAAEIRNIIKKHVHYEDNRD